MLLAVLVLAQICYPLTVGAGRAVTTVLTVLLGYLLSVSHALLTRGPRAAAALVGTATLGGFAVEAVGVATGFPFGVYDYSGELGPKLLGVPLIIPLAWTWMAWPGWLAATRLATRRPARIALAGFRWSPRVTGGGGTRPPRCPAFPVCHSATTWAGSGSPCS